MVTILECCVVPTSVVAIVWLSILAARAEARACEASRRRGGALPAQQRMWTLRSRAR